VVKRHDSDLLTAAAMLARGTVAAVEADRADPEEAWLILMLAADTIEHALTYVCESADSSAMRGAFSRELVVARARLEVLRAKSLAEHEEARKVMDAGFRVKRNPS
jgi:hypothetical protein